MDKKDISQFVSISRDRRFLTVYQEIARTIVSSLDIDRVMNLISKKMVETMGVKGATIRLLDESGEKLVLYAVNGLSQEYVKRGPLDAEKSISEALSGKSVAIYDATTDPRIQYRNEAEKEGIASILAVPIPIHGEVAGVLRLLTGEHRRYDQDEISFVESIAELCGITIENAYLYEHQKKQLNYLKAIHEVAKAINSTLNLDEVLAIIVRRIPEILDVKAVTIRLLDESKQHLELVAASGLSQKYLSRGSIDAEKNIQMVLLGKPVAIHDAAVDPRIQYRREAKEEGIASILAIPIIVKGEIIGVMRLLSEEKHHFCEEEISFAVAVAETGGIAIQNARIYEHNSSLLDEVSGLEKSKSVFMQIAAHELKSPVAVIQTLLMTLKRTFGNDFLQSASDLLSRAINRCAGMLDLIRDLLDYSRLTHLAPKEEPKEEFDLSELLREKMAPLAEMAAHKKISFNTYMDSLVLPIMALRKEISQVIENLISNALRYTPSGGEVVIRLFKDGNEVVFQVTDTGIGIPEEDIPNLFQEFYRSSNAKEFVAIGSGLGLTITKNIIDKMEGSIKVKSQLSDGTSFTVRLPVANGKM